MGEMAVEGRAGARRTRSDAGTEKGSGRSAPSTPSGRSPDANRLDGKGTPHTPGGLDELAREFFARSDTTESELNAGTGAERRPSSRADDARSVGTAAWADAGMRGCFPSCSRARPATCDGASGATAVCACCAYACRMRMQGPYPNAPMGPDQIESIITCTLRGNAQAHTRRAMGGAALGGRIGHRARIKWEAPNFLSAPAARNIQTFI